MKFLEMIIKHYDDIFPFNKETYSFLREGLLDEDKVLDVACATGTYAIALQKDGMNLCGLDIDDNMIRRAEEKAEEAFVNPDFVVSSMLNLDLVSDGDLRRIYSISNALVQLKSLEEIQTFLSLSFELLKDGGDLIIRIFNYDRILDHKIDKLPSLEVPLKGITYDRNYNFDEDSELIEFTSILNVKDQTKESSIYLFPVRIDLLLEELFHVGFREIEVYGSFKKEPYTEESISLIIKAKKVKEAKNI